MGVSRQEILESTAVAVALCGAVADWPARYVFKILEDIEIIISDGHTVAQQLLLVKGKNENLLYAADLLPMSSHIPLPWIMAYDLYPVTTIQEKENILRRAVDEEWFVFFEHDPEVPCGIICQEHDKFILKSPVKF